MHTLFWNNGLQTNPQSTELWLHRTTKAITCNFNHNLDKFHRSIQCPELPMICKCWDERFFFSDRFWNAIPQSSMIWCSPQVVILDCSSNLSNLQMLHLRSDLRNSIDPLVSSSSLQRPVDHPCIEPLLEGLRHSGRHIGAKVLLFFVFANTKHFSFLIFLIFH